MKTKREISNTERKARVEPTLFDFAEEEKKQNVGIGKHNLIEIVFAEKADWKNENGEEICFFIKKDETLNAITTGLSKDYDGNGHYNNADESFHGFLVAKEHRIIPLLQALAHPNEKNINLLTDDECHEFNLIMRNINPEYKKAYEDKLEQERRDREANAGKNATSFVLNKLNDAGIEVVTDKKEFDKRLDEINGTDVFQAMTEKFVEKEINSVPRATKEIRETLEKVLEKTAVPFTEVAYTRENYLQIFRDGIVQTPVETVKLGANQFVRLCPPDRNNLMGAIYETMTKPSIVLEKETFDEKSEKFKPVHVYGKSFINEKDKHKRAVESIVIFRDGENIAASLHNRDISKFVDQIKTADDIIYIDNEVSRVAAFSSRTGDSHVVKETQEFLSSSGRKSLPSWNKFYNPEDVLSIKKLIDDGKVQGGTVEINENNFDKYFNIFNQNLKYKDNRNKIASDLFNYHVKPENKAEMKEWLENQEYEIKEKNRQFKISNGKVYGFTDGEKIYLNPDFLNSNVAVHEYTHLWDEYTHHTNPELWKKGMSILKDTKLFSEVKSDPNYADIADNDNLVLSEVHARICGKLSQEYLERIAKDDGEIKSISATEWNGEVAEYVEKELFPGKDIFYQRYHTRGIEENELDGDAIERFLATPMIDLAKGLSIKNRDFETRFINRDFTEVFERLSDINFKTNIYETKRKEEQKKEYEKLWNELFPDGEPKEIQEKRNGWQQRIKEYEDELKLPETLKKAKAQAKKMSVETIKERLEQYEKDMYGLFPKTVAEASEINEAKFKDDILNMLGKNHNSYANWFNWDNVFVWNTTEPVSSIATDIRISVLENELKSREISIEKENKLMTKKEIIDYYVTQQNDRKMGRFGSYESMMIDWKDFIENLYMSDAITEKQRDSLTEPCTETGFEKFNERFESNVKQKVEKEPANDYDENHDTNKNENNISFFVKDTAEFEQFAQFEAIKNLTAEEAVKTFIENKEKNFRAGIGINIPGDFIFNDPNCAGAIVLDETKGKVSFYMGDSFVKELKENNEHSQNVIKAFKELDEAVKKSSIFKDGLYEEPTFLFDKEKELGLTQWYETVDEIENSYHTEQNSKAEQKEEDAKNLKAVSDEENAHRKFIDVQDIRSIHGRTLIAKNEFGNYLLRTEKPEKLVINEYEKEEKQSRKNSNDILRSVEQLEIMEINIRNENGWISADDILASNDSARKYLEEIKRRTAADLKLGKEEFSILKGDNYHTFNDALGILGVYGKEYQQAVLERLEKYPSHFYLPFDVAKEFVNGQGYTMYDESSEIEKLYAEVNPNGGNDRGFQFGVKDFEHLKNIKRLLDNFEKNPPKHSELEDLEKIGSRYSKESKRLQKIYEKEHDKDALKGSQKNADYANFYHWQAEKLNEDIIKHPNKFDSIKTWYEKAYPTDKEAVEKMSGFTSFGQLEIDIKNGSFGKESYSERYGEYDSLVRERMFQKLAEMNNVAYNVVYDTWLHSGENQNLNKESSQIENQKMSKPMMLYFGHEEREISNAPFEIIKDEKFNRVNIRFNTENKSPYFDEILKELKSNQWKYAPSKKQWYPTNLKNNPDEFAKKLLEKYSESKEKQEIKNEEMNVVKENKFSAELSENKNSPYDGIKFFDRNYLETRDFTTYFNNHIDSFEKEKPSLSENDAKYILRALNHLDVGLLEERTDRLGVDNKGQLVIFTKQKDDINITRTDLKGVIKAAKEMSEKSLKQAEEAFEKHSEKNILDDSLKSIFTKMYSECISQCKEVNVHMEEIYTKYNLEKNIERKVKSLSVNDKIGKDFVVDVYNISDGVYQATLSSDSGNGIGSVQNYFVIDSQIARKCRPEIIELMENKDGRFVVENKNNEPYILKELISKNLMPPRDESFVQKLDEFIEKHPEKYARLYPISSFNFSEKLNELANIDKELTKNPLLCGKKLISLVNENDKKSISSFLKRNGCIDDSSMKKVFSEWMRTSQIEKEEQKKIKKNDGYPPRCV